MSESEFQSLKEAYSFKDADLKNLYISEAVAIFQKYQFLSKINNILWFRSKYDKKLPFPRILFRHNNVCQKSQDLSICKSILTQICSISSSPFYLTLSQPQIDLSDMIYSVFTEFNFINNPEKQHFSWLTDFFVNSTFPAIFGHFCSYEYLKEGLSFISIFIEDQLAPKLVGSLFSQSFLFKDRLIQTFFNTLANSSLSTHGFFDDSAKKKEIIVKAFFYSFQSCLSYFSEFHFHVIKILREKRGVESAIAAIFDYFLLDGFVDAWHLSPFFSASKLLAIDQIPNILYDIFSENRQKQNNQLFYPYIDLFSETANAHSPVPVIADVIFLNGEVVAIAKLDMILANIISAYMKLRQEKDAPIPQIQSIINQMKKTPSFRMKQRSIESLLKKSISFISNLRFMFTKTSDFPQQPNPKSSEIAFLQYRRNVRQYISHLSGNLFIPRSSIKCIKNCISLRAALYAESFFNDISQHQVSKTGSSSLPIEYAEDQRLIFILNNVTNYFKFNPSLLSYVQQLLQDGYPNILLGDINNILLHNLHVSWDKFNNSSHFATIKESKYGISQTDDKKIKFSLSVHEISSCVVSTIEAILNSWKLIYNQDITRNHTQPNRINVSQLNIDIFQPTLGIFLFATNEISRHLVYIAMSKREHHIMSKSATTEQLRNQELPIILQANSSTFSFLAKESLDIIMSDPFIAIKMGATQIIQFYLSTLEEAFKEEFVHDGESFNLGWKLSSFLFIRKLLMPFSANSSNQMRKMLMTAMYKGKDPVYTRLNLINATRLIKSICVNNKERSGLTSNPQGNDSIRNQELEYLGNMLKISVFDIFGQGVLKQLEMLNQWYSLDVQ